MSEASPTSEQIERELVELGEASPDAAELELAAQPEAASSEALDAQPEVASVARLSELAEPLAFEDLSELELHRGWREIERRIDGAGTDAANEEPAQVSPGPGRWSYLAGLATVVAVAAALAFVVLQPSGELAGPEGPSAEEVAKLGDMARSSLRVLDDGKTDTQRAASLAADYERRLQEAGG